MPKIPTIFIGGNRQPVINNTGATKLTGNGQPAKPALAILSNQGRQPVIRKAK
jgi:hypothetical protein